MVLTTQGLDDVSLSDLHDLNDEGRSETEEREEGAGALVDNLPT